MNFINIINIPNIKKIFLELLYWYFLEVGNKLKIDISNIIPAIHENNIPRIKLLINFFKNKKVIIAPSGSDIADIKVYFIALILLLVL